MPGSIEGSEEDVPRQEGQEAEGPSRKEADSEERERR